ncbi:hypothetical protein ABTY96_00495 [Streptomyces sp. NPDC096057]|uniref:hypothetical protein n=1 Tax=Streptomyces sp. NPDC096057 TaxID=3155543 RepID=UPI003333A5F5
MTIVPTGTDSAAASAGQGVGPLPRARRERRRVCRAGGWCSASPRTRTRGGTGG